MRQRTPETSEDDLTSSPARNGAEVDTSKPMLRQDTNLLLTSIGANNPVNQLAAESKNVRVGQSEGASNITPSEVPPISLASPSSEQSSPTSLKLLSGSPAEWRQSLMEALGDRIQVGIGQRSEQATIRLDPPMLGSVEITIRHQAGTLQVQLSASNGEVTRQLQHISDGLRQELSQRQFTGVSVQVGNHQSDRDGRERQQYLAQTDEVPLRAWDDANTAGSSKFSLNTN
jgi:flagellar hook-length control protein FliK